MKPSTIVLAMIVSLLVYSAFVGIVASLSDEGGRFDRYQSGGAYTGVRPTPNSKFTRIAYSSPKSGNGDIFIFDVSKRTSELLIGSESYEGDAFWSGDSLYFTRENKDKLGRIFVFDFKSKSAKQLTHGPGYESSPFFDSKSQKLYFSRSGNKSWIPSNIVEYDMNSKKERLITKEHESSNNYPVIGRENEIFFVRNNGASSMIVMSSLETGMEKNICSGWDLAVNKKSNTLFVIQQDDQFDMDIVKYDMKNSKSTKLTNDGGYKSHIGQNPNNSALFYFQENSRGLGTIRKWRNGKSDDVFEVK